MGLSISWHIKVQEDQVLPPASKLGKVFQPGEHAPKNQLSARDRPDHTHAQGLGWSQGGSLNVGPETMSSHKHRSVDFVASPS